MRVTSMPGVAVTLGVVTMSSQTSLFGSAAHGEMHPESDVDFMVEFEPEARIGLIEFESLAEELESLVGRKVDLVTKLGVKPWVRPHVLKDARSICAA